MDSPDIQRAPHPFEEGPHLRAALLCERVLTETDQVKSLIRVIDRFTITSTGPNPPAQLPPSVVHFALFVSLVSGRARGSFDLAISLERPSGLRSDICRQLVTFEGEDRGMTVTESISLGVESMGVYWFHVTLDGRHVTSLPLRILYYRAQSP